jgi:hypothetical protein
VNQRLRLVTPVPQSDYEEGDMTITLVVPRACIGQPITVTLQPALRPVPANVEEEISFAGLDEEISFAGMGDETSFAGMGDDETAEIELDLDSPEVISVGRATSGAPLPMQLTAVSLDHMASHADDDVIELDLDSPEIVAVFYDDLMPWAAPARKAA